jgi:hypothetical protein
MPKEEKMDRAVRTPPHWNKAEKKTSITLIHDSSMISLEKTGQEVAYALILRVHDYNYNSDTGQTQSVT